MSTGRFLCTAQTWVDNVQAALSFATSIEAFRHCVKAGLNNVHLLVDRGVAQPAIYIPLETSPVANRPVTGFPRTANRTKTLSHE
jgi:hypothetical protein